MTDYRYATFQSGKFGGTKIRWYSTLRFSSSDTLFTWTFVQCIAELIWCYTASFSAKTLVFIQFIHNFFIWHQMALHFNVDLVVSILFRRCVFYEMCVYLTFVIMIFIFCPLVQYFNNTYYAKMVCDDVPLNVQCYSLLVFRCLQYEFIE